MLAVEIIARRTRYCSLPGNWPQNAGSRLVSSRTAIAPVSASAARVPPLAAVTFAVNVTL